MDTPQYPELHSPPRRRWRWFVLVGGLLLLPLGGLVVLYLELRNSSERELREAIADTDRRDPGWRLEDLDEQRQAIPDERNGALQVLAARRLLPAQWPAAAGEEPSLDQLLDGLEPEEQLNQEQLRVLRTELQAVQPALRQAERLAELPDGRYTIVWKVEFISTLLPHVQQGRAVARLLQLEAMRRAQDGDADGACRLEVPLINTGRSIGPEHTLLVMLIRTALLAVATQTLERTLAQGEPGEASLAAVQQLLEREEEETPALALAAFRGERALAHRMMEAIEHGDLSLSALAAAPSLGERVQDILNGGMVRHSHAVYLRYMTEAIEVAKAPGPAQAARLKELLAPVERDRKAALAAVLLPAAERVLATESRKLAQLRSTIVALALERYRRAEGRWPTSLDALTPRYLREVPTDPYDGKPLRYRRLDDGVVVYSVGPDQADNGGEIDRQHPTAEGTDLGFQLWDVTRRRQPAPLPAEDK
jgi:hypothetical protein